VARAPWDNQDDAIKDPGAAPGGSDRPAGRHAHGGSPGWTPPAATSGGQPTAPGADPGGGTGYPAQGMPAGYPAPGYPPPGAPSGYPAQPAPGGYPPPGTPTGYPAQPAPGGYPPPGTPTGYPAQRWGPQGYAPPPAGQQPGFGLRLTGMLLAIAGGLGIIVACLLPYAHLSSSGGGQSLSLITSSSPYSELWFAAEPVVVALVALVAGIVLLVSRSQGVRWAMAGILLAYGVQTPLLFAGLLFGFNGGNGYQHGPAGPAGILAGLLLLTAGILGLAGAAAGQRAAAQKGGTAAQGGTMTPA
jgi:hypothetical protein